MKKWGLVALGAVIGVTGSIGAAWWYLKDAMR